MATLKISTNEQNFIAGLQKASGAVGAFAGTMNVKLASSFKEADFYTKNFEKGLGRLANSLKTTGQGMAIGLTLPLTLLSKSASDAYAEFDALRRALGTVEPTTQGLTSKLKELREVAKMPGIGFQEAIQGEVRLRSVGISADLSIKILKEFANAVAMTGGGKAQLNEITVQLGQMAAKGKVLAQDLRPIIEAAPAVATALKNMFGTVSSEAISEQLEKTGKSSTDMITMLLTEMEKAPRVTGGWKNSLENLGDTLFVAKAEIFEVADNVFGLQSKLESIASTVTGFVEGFKDLPEPLQKTILGLVALTAVLGPLAVGIGFVITAFNSFVTVGALTVGVATGIVAVVGLLGYAFMESTARANDMKRSLESVDEITNKYSASVNTERTKIVSLLNIIRDQKSSLKDIESAKKALIGIDPSFSDSLKGEKVNFDKLYVAARAYIAQLITASKVKAMQARMDENELKSQKILEKPFDNSFLANMLPLPMRAGYQKKIIEENAQLVGFYKLQNEKLATEIAKINISTTKEVKREEIPNPFDKVGKGGKYANKIEALKAVIKEEHDLLKKQKDNELEALKESSKNAIAMAIAFEESMNPENLPKPPVEDMTKQNAAINWSVMFGNQAPLKGLSEEERKAWEDINKVQMDGLSTYEKNLAAWPETMKDVRKDLQNMSVDLMADLVSGFTSGQGMQGALKTALTAFGNYAIQLGKTILPIAKALELLKISPKPINAIALIAAGSIVRGLASNMKVPKFAEGGAVNNPTLAMIGDNASGKEMVLPFEKTGEFANKIALQMGGNGNFGGTLTTRISGRDLLILLERENRKR
jgi:tape measure domain-containing protein